MRPVLRRRRIGPALSIGALAGSGLTAAPFLLVDPLVALVALVWALVIWGIGLFLIGAPLWWLLHRVGMRGLAHAVLLGAILTGVAVGAGVWALAATVPRSPGLPFEAVIAPVGLALAAGGLIGLIVWRVAYGRPDKHAPAE